MILYRILEENSVYYCILEENKCLFFKKIRDRIRDEPNICTVP